MRVTPWEVEGIVDYEKLTREFGIQPFKDIPKELKENKLFRRGITFGHRDYTKILDAIREGRNWAVMSGFMPSGPPHFGHKMTMEEIIWHQKMKGMAFICIADIEAYVVRGLSFDKSKELGLQYIKNMIALGLKEDAYIYYQSACKDVKDLAIKLSNEVNWSELKAIYGFTPETTLSKMFVTVIQAADILQPQLEKFGGPKPTVIPVGADQDPHIRLTRDIAARISIFSFESIRNGLRIRSRKGKKYLDKIEKKLEFEFKRYEEHIDVFGKAEKIEDYIRHTFFWCPVVVLEEKIGMSTYEVVKKLKEKGIETRYRYRQPLYKQKVLQDLSPYPKGCPFVCSSRKIDYTRVYLPNAEKLAGRIVGLPNHPGLNKDDLNYILDVLEKFDKG